LSLVLTFGKVLRKLVVVWPFGKKPPVQVVPLAVAPTVHPVNAMLTGLITAALQLPPAAHPAAALIASTILFDGSGPPGLVTVSGTPPVPFVVPNTLPIKSRRPS
jgi:hypothetical protein